MNMCKLLLLLTLSLSLSLCKCDITHTTYKKVLQVSCLTRDKRVVTINKNTLAKFYVRKQTRLCSIRFMKSWYCPAMLLTCPKFSVPPNSWAKLIIKSNGGRGRKIRYHDGNWPGMIRSRDHLRIWYTRERSEDEVELQCKVVEDTKLHFLIPIKPYDDTSLAVPGALLRLQHTTNYNTAGAA